MSISALHTGKAPLWLAFWVCWAPVQFAFGFVSAFLVDAAPAVLAAYAALWLCWALWIARVLWLCAPNTSRTLYTVLARAWAVYGVVTALSAAAQVLTR